MNAATTMMLQQMAAVEASAKAFEAQVAALRETLKLVETAYQEPEAPKPGCPNCGSSNRIDMPTMGGKLEAQCQDCRTLYEPK